MPKKRSKSVIIIGAGFGGLASAALLAKAGLDVTVIEKNEQSGGKAGLWKKDGFTFDMGPSWYLMPDLFEHFFAHFNSKPEDHFQLQRLDPAYTVYWSRDQKIAISPEFEKNIQTFNQFEPNGGDQLQAYINQAQDFYESAVHQFIYHAYINTPDYIQPKLLANPSMLAAMFKSFDQQVSSYFKSDTAKQILEFSTMFLGGSPYNTPALYTILSYADLKLGVWYPHGGVGVVAKAMEKLGKQHGVSFKYGHQARHISSSTDGISIKTNKDTFSADFVISNADYAHTELELLDNDHRSYPQSNWDKVTWAPSTLLMYLGIDKKVPHLDHHNIIIKPNWQDHFDTIYKTKQWPEDPSYYVSAPSKTDTSVAPKGKENIFVLIPIASGIEDTKETQEKYFNWVIDDLEKLTGSNIKDHIVLKRLFSANDFHNRYNAQQGTAFGLAHTLKQTAFFRPRMRSRKLKRLYYCGQYTHPGIGVPTSIASGEIVAQAILKEITHGNNR